MDTEKKTFDIGKLAAMREADMEVTEADGSPTGWIWTFAGPGHPATIEADRRQVQRVFDREAEKERAQTNYRKWKGEAQKVEEARIDKIAYFVSRLLRWNDGMTMEGEPYPCSPENATAVLSDPDMSMLVDQVNLFLNADKSFMKRSAKS